MPLRPASVAYHRRGVEGVAQDALRLGAGMVADEEGNVRTFEALHHREGLALAHDKRRPRVEALEEDVSHPVVGLVDQKLGGAAADRPVDSGIHVGGQEPTEALVLGAARYDVLGDYDILVTPSVFAEM
jgi:hypothetical protein